MPTSRAFWWRACCILETNTLMVFANTSDGVILWGGFKSCTQFVTCLPEADNECSLVETLVFVAQESVTEF
jgi:hypothetical protein